MGTRTRLTIACPTTVAALLAAVAFWPANAAASAAPAAHAAHAAHAARACSLVGKYESLGPTYVERLSVSGTSCATGVKLIKAYNVCRLKAGGPKGRCRSVMGFRISETRSSSSVQFVAVVRATKGPAVVNFAYSENV